MNISLSDSPKLLELGLAFDFKKYRKMIQISTTSFYSAQREFFVLWDCFEN